jgi:hypothetical protein
MGIGNLIDKLYRLTIYKSKDVMRKHSYSVESSFPVIPKLGHNIIINLYTLLIYYILYFYLIRNVIVLNKI